MLQQYFKFYDRQRLEEARAAGKRLLIHWVANVDGGGRFIRDSLLGSLQAYMDLVVECFGDDPASELRRVKACWCCCLYLQGWLNCRFPNSRW